MALYAIAARIAASRSGAVMRASSARRMAIEVARFVFYVGLPYAALWTGTFAPRDVGLQGSPAPDLMLGWMPEDWVRAIGQAVGLGTLTLITVAALAWQVRRAGGYAASALGVDSAPAAQAIREGVLVEAHWSFYRALPMVLLGDARWAALAGLGFATGEAVLGGRTHTGAHYVSLFEALLAGLSATYFALTGGNVWLAIVLQIGMRAAVTQLANAGRHAESPNEIIV